MSELIKPEILKGTRDFLPERKQKRDYIIDQIKVFLESLDSTPLKLQ